MTEKPEGKFNYASAINADAPDCFLISTKYGTEVCMFPGKWRSPKPAPKQQPIGEVSRK